MSLSAPLRLGTGQSLHISDLPHIRPGAYRPWRMCPLLRGSFVGYATTAIVQRGRKMIVDFQHHFTPRELIKQAPGDRLILNYDASGAPSYTIHSLLYDLDEHVR